MKNITSDLPNSFLNRMQSQLGDKYGAFIKSLGEPAVVSLRINPLKNTGLFSKEEKVPWCHNGRYLSKRPDFVFDPLIHAGAYYVQEASSMFIADFIDFTKDLKILDLCAAPGGKSTLLLSLMNKGSILFCNELVSKRAVILYENIVKWGYPNVVVTNNRPEDYSIFNNYFDVVLVDAPCSGEGLFRKSPKYIHEWRDNKSRQCAVVQRNILDTAFSLLKENGILIYSTCTYSPVENEEIVKHFYAKFRNAVKPNNININSEMNVSEEIIEFPDGNQLKTYKFYPHRLKGEGFFISSFMKKTNKNEDHNKKYKSRGSVSNVDQHTHNVLAEFAAIPAGYQVICREENIYAVQEKFRDNTITAFDFLNVLKAGVMIGTFNRRNKVFIPSHELAMSPFLRKDFPYIEVNESDALRFLKKENIITDSSVIPGQGWVIAKYKGLPLGWLKKSGNKINNFYPKNWKIRKSIEEFI